MAHGAALRQETHAGDTDVINIATDWHNAPSLDAQDIAMLDFVEKVALNASSCTKDDVNKLKALGFSDQEVLEIVLVTCWFSVQNRLADALGVELDERLRSNEALVQAFGFGKEV